MWSQVKSNVRFERVWRSVFSCPLGGLYFFRGHMAHCGVENASLNVIIRPHHAYLTLCDSSMPSDPRRDATCPGKEVR